MKAVSKLPFRVLDFRCVDPCWKFQSNGVLCINPCCVQLSHRIPAFTIDFGQAQSLPAFHGRVPSSDGDGTAMSKSLRKIWFLVAI